jgi:hypothetical protein
LVGAGFSLLLIFPHGAFGVFLLDYVLHCGLVQRHELEPGDGTGTRLALRSVIDPSLALGPQQQPMDRVAGEEKDKQRKTDPRSYHDLTIPAFVIEPTSEGDSSRPRPANDAFEDEFDGG